VIDLALTLAHPAQTNLQLYEQLRAAGVPVVELAAVRRAHDLAAQLFTGQNRANGKAFIAHLVGTASILAALGERGEVVRAGLLHAVYANGVRHGRRPAHGWLAAQVGDGVERLLDGYHKLAWDAVAIAGYQEQPLAPLERDLVVMRVANELEDRVDLGLAYSRKHAELGAVSAALAGKLGLPALAAALTEADRAHHAAKIPAELVSERKKGFQTSGFGGLVARVRDGVAARFGRSR
jgi:hypothetical protein